jgi:hypothetical protein
MMDLTSPVGKLLLLAAVDRTDPRPLLQGPGRARLINFRCERYVWNIEADAITRARREGI